jgi:hypothetical protein
MRILPRKRNSKWKKFWNLRYRFYAILVILSLSPLVFYASDKDIPENIAVEGLGYEIIDENVLASRLRRLTPDDDILAINEPTPVADRIEIVDGEIIVYDKDGRVITEQLRRAGIDMGFISSQPFVDFGAPVTVAKKDEELIPETEEVEEPPVTPLEEIVPAPRSGASQQKNLLIYDKYKIRVPLIYTTFADLFAKKSDGSFDFTKPTDTSAIDSPVQRKLEDGIVHLAYTPQPGEIGNSYIVGHSSNYSWVDSPYNKVFAPIKEKSQPGEEFIIYDRFGRELRFRVFETLKIRDDETNIAYKNYEDKRVVTLQTSILGTRNGRIEATHRWLTRGELIE